MGLEIKGELDEAKLNEWLGKLLRERGQDIFRMKGIFALRGKPHEVVFQGVHMLFEAQDGRPWGRSTRASRLVFIGRHLDRDALGESIKHCEADS